MDDLKYGLVLEGGGAKGAYQFGVWTALRELKIPICGVVGTSIGALNGAAIIQKDYDILHELWNNLKASYILNISDDIYEKIKKYEFFNESFSDIFKEIFETIDIDGLDVTPLKELIANVIDEEKIRKSKMDFGLVTVSLSDIKPVEIFIEDIPEGQLCDYLLASSYVPLFKREKIHGKYYIDGWFYNNLPTNMLVEKGYKHIIEVRLNPKKTTYREYEGIDLITIQPKEPLGRALNFDSINSKKNIKLGYYDTMREFRNLAGASYYFEMDMEEGYFLEMVHKVGFPTIKNIYEILGLWRKPHPRGFFEDIIPELMSIIGIEKNASYLEFFVAIYEYLGELLRVDRFKIYKFSEFFSNVNESLMKDEHCIKDDGDMRALILSKIKVFTKEQRVEETVKQVILYHRLHKEKIEKQ